MKQLINTFLFVLLVSLTNAQVQVVTLNGSASSDPDGNIAKWQWVQVGTTPSVCVITNADKAIATVVPANGLQWQPGTYTFQITVTDNLGATSSATTHVTFTALPPSVEAGTGQTITLPVNNAALHASGTVVFGKAKTWKWIQVSGPNAATFNRTDTSVAVVSNLIAGTYLFKVTLTDQFNASATDSVTVIVKAANIVPKADAGGDQSIQLPTNSVSLGGMDAPNNATIKWRKLSGPASFLIESPLQSYTKVSQLTQGTYVFEKAVTSNGLTSNDEVTVTVKKKCSWLARLFGLCK